MNDIPPLNISTLLKQYGLRADKSLGQNFLQDSFALEAIVSYKNVHVTHGDILKLSPHELVSTNDYLVVANIPYYITSAVIRHLLESENKPRRIVLTIQKEVAERVCAKAGDMSMLALSVQVYGNPRIAARIPAS